MAKPRLQLHAKLKAISGVVDAYFQAPADLQMSYPCLRYELSDIDIAYADNHVYRNMNRYEIVLIDPNPDSLIKDDILALPYCSFNRFYTADNLNHFVFALYF